MYEHNALGYWSGLALCLTKVRSSRARCPATALIIVLFTFVYNYAPNDDLMILKILNEPSDVHVFEFSNVLYNPFLFLFVYAI